MLEYYLRINGEEVKIIGCSRLTYIDWSNKNQIDENTIYLVDEGAEANCRVTYEVPEF